MACYVRKIVADIKIFHGLMIENKKHLLRRNSVLLKEARVKKIEHLRIKISITGRLPQLQGLREYLLWVVALDHMIRLAMAKLISSGELLTPVFLKRFLRCVFTV